MFGAVKGFIALVAVMAIAIVALLVLNVMQLQRGGATITIVVTATPPPTVVAVVARPTDAPLPVSVPPTPVAPTVPSASPIPPASPTPAATATPAPTATPVPTPTPAPKPGDVLYRADWTNAAGGFAGTGWTYVSGMFVSDGSSGNGEDFLAAPYQPPSIDYALEAEIQIVGKAVYAGCGMGLIARVDDKGAIRGGIGCPSATSYKPGLVIATEAVDRGRNLNNGDIATQTYKIDGNWHTYRLSVKGNTITLTVDGQAQVMATDNTHLKNGKIGIIGQTQCSVRSFKVLAV